MGSYDEQTQAGKVLEFQPKSAFEVPPAVKNMDLGANRTWLAIGFESPKPSLDPNIPPMLMIGLRAVRSDQVPIRIEGGLKLIPLRMLPRADEVAGHVMGLLKKMGEQLETYRNCECQQDKPCKTHQSQQGF